jgi:hypothetical protein
MNEWLKIKVCRDFNKINKQTSNSLFMINHLNNIKKSFSPNYRILLEMVTNVYLYNNTNNAKKLTITDLNNMDFDIIVEVSKFNNVQIVNSPMFTYFHIENNNIFSNSLSVSSLENIDTLEYIKTHPGYMFHIYQISSNKARWHQREDKNLLKRNRKEKLKKLNEI